MARSYPPDLRQRAWSRLRNRDVSVRRVLQDLLIIFGVLALSIPGRAEENAPRELLSKEASDALQQHAITAYESTKKVTPDLFLSPEDQRVLLHLPKRGFPYLAALFESSPFTGGYTTRFTPDTNLQSFSKEEAIAGELFAEAMFNRILANKYTCFHLVKTLAPSAEAMLVEKQAKDLVDQLNSAKDPWTEAWFLDNLKAVRGLFDRLSTLRQLTNDEFSRERAESAVLAPGDYEDGITTGDPPVYKKWPEEELSRQGGWEHEGFLVAYAENTDPRDYNRFQMVVKPLGGIFEASQPYTGSHFFPDSFECRLRPDDLRLLTEFLTQLPVSNATGEGIHFVISFSKDGKWVTRTYGSLPPGNPLQSLLQRMISQSTREQTDALTTTSEFLDAEQ